MASRSVPSTSITAIGRPRSNPGMRTGKLAVRLGLSMIKGLSARAAETVVRARRRRAIPLVRRLRGTNPPLERGPLPAGGRRCVRLAGTRAPAGPLAVTGRDPASSHYSRAFADDEPPPPLPPLSPPRTSSWTTVPRGCRCGATPRRPARVLDALERRAGGDAQRTRGRASLSSRRPGPGAAAAEHRQGHHVHDARRRDRHDEPDHLAARLGAVPPRRPPRQGTHRHRLAAKAGRRHPSDRRSTGGPDRASYPISATCRGTSTKGLERSNGEVPERDRPPVLATVLDVSRHGLRGHRDGQ